MPAVDSPVFRMETRKRQTLTHVKRQHVLVLLTAVALMLILWALPLMAVDSSRTGGNFYYYDYTDTSASTIGWLLVASLGFNLLLDMVSLAMSINSISGDINQGHWDLLRLTPLRENEIIQAKYAAAQLRSWRMMLWVIGLRLGVLILCGFHLWIIPVLDGYRNDVFGNLFGSIFEYPVEFFSFFISLLVFTAIYLIEPVWRMQALAALGLSISARIRQLIFSTLAALGALVAVWISQAMIMGGILWSLFSMLSSMVSSAVAFCCITTACITTAFVIRLYYQQLKNWALSSAVKHAFAS
jgi:hypothetical protein